MMSHRQSLKAESHVRLRRTCVKVRSPAEIAVPLAVMDELFNPIFRTPSYASSDRASSASCSASVWRSREQAKQGFGRCR